MKRLFAALFAIACAATAFAAEAARPLLSPVFGDHMVLQRGQSSRLWGWAETATQISVSFAGQERHTTADSEGKWLVVLDPLEASSGPRDLIVAFSNRKSENITCKLTDVLVGDVWLCSGQSNMELGLARSRDGAAAVKQATHESIRLFRVASTSAYEPKLVPEGAWQRCEPAAFDAAGGFSAVAYYFGRKLQAETGVPIGLIQAAVGGTPAESWMSPAAVAAFPEFAPGLAETARLRARGGPVYSNYVMPWYDEFDRGVAGKWSEAAFDDTVWQAASLHDVFQKLGVPSAPAVVWLRREITLPHPLPAGPARLLLGVVERMDTAWLNGRWVGASAWVENPRAYAIPAGVLKPGRNQLTIRVLKTAPGGGFRSPPKALQLVLGDGTAIPLEDGWRAALGIDAHPPHRLPLGYENWPTMPAVLHHGMVAPLAPIALAGVIWYQGEANFTRAQQYRSLLPALIADWRQLFNRPDLPFYIASLPAFMKRRDQPGTDDWTDLREAQLLTARTVPHTGVAITVDTGEADDIHPADKQPVGERLARLALRDVYAQDIISQGPVLARVEKLAGTLRLHFSHADGGLVVHGDRLGEFSVAGAAGAWHWAEARLEGDTVIVSSSAVPEPVAVRYAWQANPLASLFNGAGLPAAPFRTDR